MIFFLNPLFYRWVFLFKNNLIKLRYTNMQVFKPNDLSHVLKFISRNDSTQVVLKIRNELRNTDTEIEITGVVFNDIFIGVFTYNFVEGGTYEIEVCDVLENLLYRGKAFATNETDLQNFKLIK